MYFSMKFITLANYILVTTFYSGIAEASAGGNSSNAAYLRNNVLYDRLFYVGSEAQGIVRVYYQTEKRLWKRQPNKCYGVLVNWREAVVPCSCVSYTQNDSDTRTPFNYYKSARGMMQGVRGSRITKHLKINYLKPKTVEVVNESYIRVGIMQDENDSLRNQSINLVKVTKIKIHPKCDSFYNVNFATLELETKIEGSRLVWVNQAVKRRLAEDIAFTAVASAISGQCFVVRWVDKKSQAASLTKGGDGVPPFEWLKSSNNSSNKASSSAVDKLNSKLILSKDYVAFTSWDSCKNNVCPLKPGASATIRHHDSYCSNEIAGKRWCTQWTEDDAKLCGLPEGTPVFCHVREFKGIMGFLYNTPFNCDRRSRFSGIMASFEDALDLVKYHLPLRHSVEYINSLPSVYDDDYFREPMKFEELKNDAASNSLNAHILACAFVSGVWIRTFDP